MREQGVEKALGNLHLDVQFEEVADGLAVGHRVPSPQSEKGAKAAAICDLATCGVIGLPPGPFRSRVTAP